LRRQLRDWLLNGVSTRVKRLRGKGMGLSVLVTVALADEYLDWRALVLDVIVVVPDGEVDHATVKNRKSQDQGGRSQEGSNKRLREDHDAK
jgi:hypothetical protein